MRYWSLLLACQSLACSAHLPGSISPACQGIEVPATLEMLRTDTPLRRALAYVGDGPRSIRGASVQGRLAHHPSKIGVSLRPLANVPHFGDECVRALAAPTFEFVWLLPQSSQGSSTWIGTGVGASPYLQCVAHLDDHETLQRERCQGEVLPAPSLPGLLVQQSCSPSDPEYYAPETTILFDLHAYQEATLLHQIPRPRDGELPPGIVERMRKVDVTRDVFEVSYEDVLIGPGKTLGQLRRTFHLDIVKAGEVRACYTYEFDRAEDARWAGDSIEVLLDLLGHWGSQPAGVGGDQPDPSVTIHPGQPRTFTTGKLTGIEADVSLDSLEHLSALADVAVDASIGSRKEDDVRYAISESIWRMLQPRAGKDYD
jgi:hypothetical protein